MSRRVDAEENRAHLSDTASKQLANQGTKKDSLDVLDADSREEMTRRNGEPRTYDNLFQDEKEDVSPEIDVRRGKNL